MHDKLEFIGRLRSEAGIASADDAEQALEAVFAALKRRLSRDESAYLADQLPDDVEPLWSSLPAGQSLDNAVLPESLADAGIPDLAHSVAAETGLAPGHAVVVTESVFHMLKEQISDAEVGQVSEQLPPSLQEVWDLA